VYYLIYGEDAADSFEKRRSVAHAHLQYLATLQQQNRLLLAGPLYQQDTDEPYPFAVNGSLIIADFSNIDLAKAWAAADPYTTAGVFAKITVSPFKKVLP